MLATLAAVFLVVVPLLWLAGGYHVFGTDKVGQDVLYQVLKSVRTGLIIGLVTTLVTLPLAVLLGIVAGYFRAGSTTSSSISIPCSIPIPGVLLIAAAVLMMQVVIDTHPQWFSTAAERADLRLLALCFILGITSWTGCAGCCGRNPEAAGTGIHPGGPGLRRLVLAHHRPPHPAQPHAHRHHRPGHGFSGLVLAEAVLSYVGIGVDPTMVSFGTMINNARMELGREPAVWWSLAAAFAAMFILVLAANLFADAVRDAFDPRAA